MTVSTSHTVTPDTTLRELALLLARSRVRVIDFKLDRFGEYFVKAESEGRFYCGLSDKLHHCFAQILDEIAAASLGVHAPPPELDPNGKKQTCRWCGETAVLRDPNARPGEPDARPCTKSPKFYCEPRGRGHRGPDKTARRPKVEPTP